MDPSPLVSIILPVYNAALTLPRTLAALRQQTYTNLEIIAIDDGSTDGSGRMLDQEAGLDARIKVIHTENEGAWRARKAGISIATGTYIGFCDADDLPMLQMYGCLLQKAISTSADITICAFQRVDVKNGRLLKKELTKFGDAIYEVVDNPGTLASINTALWNKLFFASILKTGLRFDDPPRVLEDMMLLCAVYPSCKRIAFISDPLYRYIVNPGSAMATVEKRELDQLVDSLRQTREWIAKQTDDARFRDVFDLMTFIHFGLSVPLRLQCSNEKNWCQSVREIFLLLDQYFPGYQKNPYTTLRYNLRNHMENGKIMLLLWFKNLHLLLPALKLFRRMRGKMKADIHW